LRKRDRERKREGERERERERAILMKWPDGTGALLWRGGHNNNIQSFQVKFLKPNR
jgi:hypothetical protein